MPTRAHVSFNDYSWFQHARDAVNGVRCPLKRLGLWTAVEQAVDKVDTGVLVQQITSPNEAARKKVLEGVIRPYNLPNETVLAILDEENMRSLSYVFKEAPDAPMQSAKWMQQPAY